MRTPRLIPDPRTGRPVSEWDLAHGDVPPGFRATPDGLRSVEALYAEDAARPGRPLLFTLQEASSIKDSYWTGRETIAALARLHGVTEVTISRLVHGRTYWYA